MTFEMHIESYMILQKVHQKEEKVFKKEDKYQWNEKCEKSLYTLK